MQKKTRTLEGMFGCSFHTDQYLSPINPFWIHIPPPIGPAALVSVEYGHSPTARPPPTLHRVPGPHLGSASKEERKRNEQGKAWQNAANRKEGGHVDIYFPLANPLVRHFQACCYCCSIRFPMIFTRFPQFSLFPPAPLSPFFTTTTLGTFFPPHHRWEFPPLTIFPPRSVFGHGRWGSDSLSLVDLSPALPPSPKCCPLRVVPPCFCSLLVRFSHSFALFPSLCLPWSERPPIFHFISSPPSDFPG